MSDIIEVTQGDDLPSVSLDLKDSNSGERTDPETWDAIDLSNVTTITTIKLRLKGGDGTVLATATTTKVNTGSDGKLAMVWPSGFLDNAPGNYEGEIAVSYNSLIQTIAQALKIRILPQF